jgi:hypothetical protein
VDDFDRVLWPTRSSADGRRIAILSRYYSDRLGAARAPALHGVVRCDKRAGGWRCQTTELGEFAGALGLALRRDSYGGLIVETMNGLLDAALADR